MRYHKFCRCSIVAFVGRRGGCWGLKGNPFRNPDRDLRTIVAVTQKVGRLSMTHREPLDLQEAGGHLDVHTDG